MLEPQLVQRVERLLAAGRKQREIARLTGVSRATIQRIQHGTRRTDAAETDPDQADGCHLQFHAEHWSRYEEIHRRKVARDPRAA